MELLKDHLKPYNYKPQKPSVM